MENIIEINGLCKSYGDVVAVDNLSFKVKKGELFAFLGINGAGKSTTISIMCGANKADSGSIFICGEDALKNIDKITPKIGVVFQQSVLDNVLTVKDNLLSRASLYGINGKFAKERIKDLSALLEFSDLLNRPINKLSGGQRRRIDVARALIHNPEILILDEPTTGLDPMTRKNMWGVINDLRREKNITVFLTTHYMEETTNADYIVIIDEGKIAAQGTVYELKNDYTGDFITIYNVNEDEIQKLGLPYEVLHDAFRISVKDTKQAKELIIKYPELFVDFEISKGKMDDVFLNATGKKLERVVEE